MTNSQSRIDYLITHAKEWSIDGQRISVCTANQHGSESHHPVETGELEQRHPLLLNVVMAMPGESDFSGVKTIPGSSVRGNLAFLENAVIWVNDEHCGLLPVLVLLTVNDRDVHAPYIPASGNVVFFEPQEDFGPGIPLVESVGRGYMNVERAFWNKHYPGWSERLKIGTDLGIPRKELMNYVFSTEGRLFDNGEKELPSDFTL